MIRCLVAAEHITRLQTGAKHRLDLLVSGRDIMAGGLPRPCRGVVGQGQKGRVAHVAPGKWTVWPDGTRGKRPFCRIL